MQSEFIEKSNGFSMPATYSIHVEGLLDERWPERLGGMNVETIKENHLPLMTVLSGRLTDQAELLGVLNALYNLRVTLLAVRRQDEPQTKKYR